MVLFRKSVKKWIHKDPTQYFLSDARLMPFKDGTFDTIVDRATHKMVCDNSLNLFREHIGRWIDKDDEIKLNAAEHLIPEYERVLKKHGKIVFLFSVPSMAYLDSILYSLRKREFSIIEGKAKSSLTITIGGRPYITDKGKVHKVVYYVVAIKK
jgi:SAM-dependent methyltransferase